MKTPHLRRHHDYCPTYHTRRIRRRYRILLAYVARTY